MEQQVTVMQWYVVTGTAGATVSTPEGVTLCTIPDGGQGAFFAITPIVVTSDDSVSVVKATFKYAPAKLRALGLLGGGDSTLPAGYLAAEFMQNSELGWVDTGLKSHGDTAVECEFVPTVYNWVNFYYSSGGHNSKPVMYGSFDYNKAYGRRFTYGYGNNNLVRLDGYDGKPGYSSTLGQKYTTAQIGGAFYINGEFVYEIAYEEYESNSNLCFFGSQVNGNVGVKNLQMHRAKVSRAGVKQRDFVPAIDPFGVPCLFDRVSKEPFYFRAFTEGAVLIAGMTCKQALQLARLPAGGGTLKVALPWDAQLDKKVDAALSEAKAKGWTIVVQYQEPDETSAVYNKYSACTNKADMEAVDPNYKNDLTADNSWVYELPNLVEAAYLLNDFSRLKKFAIKSLPKLIRMYFAFSGCANLKTWTTKLPVIASLDRAFFNSGLEVFDLGGETLNVTVTQLAFSYCENLRVFNAVFSNKKITHAQNTFEKCILDKDSVLRIAGSALPSNAGLAFTIGIHKDHENDPEVMDALALMEANGWALTVQWNGTATAQTASTWGLRRKLVYAKVVEIDGTQYLDWGHYVTNWAENGYQEFASEEEAKEYFNIGD